MKKLKELEISLAKKRRFPNRKKLVNREIETVVLNTINPMNSKKYSTINVLGTALKQPITRSKMSIFHSRLELGVPDDTENCPPLLFFSYDQNLMTAEKF